MSHPNMLLDSEDGIPGIEISHRERKKAITAGMNRAMCAALAGKQRNPDRGSGAGRRAAPP